MDTSTLAAGVPTVLMAVAGWAFRLYAEKQKESRDAQTGKIQELETEAKERTRGQHAIDLRLTAAEANLHATRNNVAGIQGELIDIRENMARRDDLQTLTTTIMERIESLSIRRK